mmetsp:Transcript_7156/g.14769  ORF Transcript_7156/g.14769 Transcript_7156/m.14769 type:complete len:200 (+) Transcript_7156:147-746(+)
MIMNLQIILLSLKHSLHFLRPPFFSCVLEKYVVGISSLHLLQVTISSLTEPGDPPTTSLLLLRRRSKDKAFLSARQSLAVFESVTVCFCDGPSLVSLTLREYLICFFSLVSSHPPSMSASSTVRDLIFACGAFCGSSLSEIILSFSLSLSADNAKSSAYVYVKRGVCTSSMTGKFSSRIEHRWVGTGMGTSAGSPSKWT